MGRIGSLAFFLKEALDSERYGSKLVYVDEVRGIFKIAVARKSNNLDADCIRMLLDWNSKNGRTLTGENYYSIAKQGLLMALRRSNYLDFVCSTRTDVTYRFLSSEEFKDKLKSKKEQRNSIIRSNTVSSSTEATTSDSIHARSSDCQTENLHRNGNEGRVLQDLDSYSNREIETSVYMSTYNEQQMLARSSGNVSSSTENLSASSIHAEISENQSESSLRSTGRIFPDTNSYGNQEIIFEFDDFITEDYARFISDQQCSYYNREIEISQSEQQTSIHSSGNSQAENLYRNEGRVFQDLDSNNREIETSHSEQQPSVHSSGNVSSSTENVSANSIHAEISDNQSESLLRSTGRIFQATDSHNNQEITYDFDSFIVEEYAIFINDQQWAEVEQYLYNRGEQLQREPRNTELQLYRYKSEHSLDGMNVIFCTLVEEPNTINLDETEFIEGYPGVIASTELLKRLLSCHTSICFSGKYLFLCLTMDTLDTYVARVISDRLIYRSLWFFIVT